MSLGFEELKEVMTGKDVKPIQNYENYTIDIKGRVFGESQRKYLSAVSDKDGYERIVLCKDGEVKAFQVHRLLAETFIEVPKRYGKISISKLEINHLDKKRNNNCTDNIEWCLPEENKIIMAIAKTWTKPFGVKDLMDIYKGTKEEMQKKYKFSELVYIKIKELYDNLKTNV